MERLRTALVGCGKVGGIHATALATLPESEFVAACDDQPDRAGAFAAKYGVKAFTDVQTMMDATVADVVLIATPHPLHAAPTIAAARAGAAVLVEKPLAATLEDCDAMLAATGGGARLGVISQRRWYEPVRRMKEAIEAGKIGKPALGVFQMYSWRDPSYYRSDPWRGRWDTEGGGVLVNQSPHQLDLLMWLMGEPVVEVAGAWANVNHPGVEVDDTAVATLRFAGGGLGAIVTSVAQKPGLFTKVHVHGTNGASVGVETDRGATFIAGVSTIAEPPLNDLWNVPGEEHLLASFQAEDRARFAAVDVTTHYHALQIQDFLRTVAAGRPPAVTGEEGRRVVALFAAIYRSQAERGIIKLDA